MSNSWAGLNNTSDAERAEELLEYTDALPVEPLLMPLCEGKRGPVIRGECRLDSERAKDLLVSPSEAARRIREQGVRGFYIYAGKPSHGTEDLLFLDRDEPSLWPDTPDTLRVNSGGNGPSDHLTCINDGSVQGADGKDDRDGAGSVITENVGVVTPGSKHHKTENVYRMEENPGVATLSATDLPRELKPTSSSSGGDGSYIDPEIESEEAIAIVEAAFRSFRDRSDTSRRAREYFDDMKKGRNYKKWGFKTEDNDEDRSKANVSLASNLYGMLFDDGEQDDDRNQYLIEQYLKHVAQEYPNTSNGNERKLRLYDENYLENTVTEAINTFDRQKFIHWRRKKKKIPQNGEYGDDRYRTVYRVADRLIQNPDKNYDYPSRGEIAEYSRILDHPKPLTVESYENIVSNHPRLRKAKLPDGFVYYPSCYDDPEQAGYVQSPDKKTKYEPGTLDSWEGGEVKQ